MSSEDGWGGEHLTWTRTWSPTRTLPATPSSSAGPPAPAVAPPAPPCCPTHRGLHFRGSPALLLAAGWGVVVVVGWMAASASSHPAPQAAVGPHTPRAPAADSSHSPSLPRPLVRPAWGQQPGRGVIAAPRPSSESCPQGVSWGSQFVGCPGAGVPAPPGEQAPPRGPPSGPGRVVPLALSSPQARVRVLVSQESPGQGRLRQPVVATTRTLSGQVQPGSMSPPRGPGLRSGQGGLAPLLPAGPGALTRPHRPEPPPKAGYTVAFLRARGSAAPRMSSPSPVQLPRGTSLCW